MATSGPNNPGSVSTALYGLFDWTDPSNAAVAGGGIAYVQQASDDFDTYYLMMTNFGFSIPAGTIDGIEVSVRRADSNVEGSDYSVMLIVGGSLLGSDQAGFGSLGSSFGNYPVFNQEVFGGSANLWGLSPTVSQVNASNFGVAYAAYGSTNLGDGFLAVDGIQMTIYYTASGGATGAQSRSLVNSGLINGGLVNSGLVR